MQLPWSGSAGGPKKVSLPEDATQEILLRIVTRLSEFDFRRRLKTWAYRVAVNYILDVKKSPVERQSRRSS